MIEQCEADLGGEACGVPTVEGGPLCAYHLVVSLRAQLERVAPKANAYDQIAIGLRRTEDEIRRVVYAVCTMGARLQRAERGKLDVATQLASRDKRIAELERETAAWHAVARRLGLLKPKETP